MSVFLWDRIFLSSVHHWSQRKSTFCLKRKRSVERNDALSSGLFLDSTLIMYLYSSINLFVGLAEHEYILFQQQKNKY